MLLLLLTFWPKYLSCCFSVIQLLVKSLWHRIKVAMGLKKCCRVVSSFAAEACRLCCRVVISLKLSCSFEQQVEYDTELSAEPSYSSIR